MFQTVFSLDHHLRKFHGDFFNENAPSDRSETLTSLVQHEQAEVVYLQQSEAGSMNFEQPDPSTMRMEESAAGTEDINSAVGATFVLNLLSERKLNQVSVQHVIGETSKLVDKVVESQLHQIKSVLHANGIDPSCLNHMKFDAKSEIFRGMQNERSQNIFFQRELGMITPTTILLDPTSKDVARHRTRKDQCLK